MNRAAVIVIAACVVFAGATMGFANGQGASVSLLGDEESVVVTFDVDTDADDPSFETRHNGRATPGNETGGDQGHQPGENDQSTSSSTESSNTDEPDTPPVNETADNSSAETDDTGSTAPETTNAGTGKLLDVSENRTTDSTVDESVLTDSIDPAVDANERGGTTDDRSE